MRGALLNSILMKEYVSSKLFKCPFPSSPLNVPSIRRHMAETIISSVNHLFEMGNADEEIKIHMRGYNHNLRKE